MCCFSQPVDLIADTNIFARASKDGKQYLVYAMTMSAKEDLAMILPIPAPKSRRALRPKMLDGERTRTPSFEGVWSGVTGFGWGGRP